jgi:hypothetical protein
VSLLFPPSWHGGRWSPAGEERLEREQADQEAREEAAEFAAAWLSARAVTRDATVLAWCVTQGEVQMLFGSLVEAAESEVWS